jgi:ribosomal protein L29
MEAEKITVMTVQAMARSSAIQELNKRISDLKKRLFDEAEQITNLDLHPKSNLKFRRICLIRF